MSPTQAESSAALQVLEACTSHARRILASQMPLVASRGYDFMPSFQEMTTHLYLIGIMWRFGEQFDLPTSARDRSFIGLLSMLVSDGKSMKEAQRKIAHLNQVSRTASGQDNFAIAAGYKAEEADGSLVNVFENFRHTPEVAGAPYRLLDRSKPVAAVLAIAGLIISLIFNRSWVEAIGVGIVLGASILAVALLIYKQMVKAKHSMYACPTPVLKRTDNIDAD